MDFQKTITNLLKKETKLKTIPLEVPPSQDLGDYAFPCFILSKQLKKSPVEIAINLSKKLKLPPSIKQVKPTGPYLNFFINKEKLAELTIKSILKEKDNYGKGSKKKEKVMVEFSQPNTHKAFHVGHIRGTSIGESLARILTYQGYNVTRANYMGDSGAHVAKWLWCYLKFHKGEKPPKYDPEKWIASIYVEAVKKTNENTQKDVCDNSCF